MNDQLVQEKEEEPTCWRAEPSLDSKSLESSVLIAYSTDKCSNNYREFQ
jgi:hypothetical protein